MNQGRARHTAFFREPPNVIHEFIESMVIGPKGYVITADKTTETHHQ